MNENVNVSKTLGLAALVFISVALIVGIYIISTPKPVNVPPRAEESDVYNLFFRVIDSNERQSVKNINLVPGKDFALLLTLSRASSLEQNKKYKFRLKFDYNAEIFDLKTPYNRKLNEAEIINGDILTMDSVFTATAVDRVEEREVSDDAKKGANIRTVDIEGWFKSDNYASLDDASIPEEKKDRMVIIALRKFQVRPTANLNNLDAHLFYWYRGDTKIERVDEPGFINPNERLKLEMVDKDVRDFPIGEAVTPQPGSDISRPFGAVKTDQIGQTGPVGTGTMTLNLSLRFQGILQKPEDRLNRLPVKVTIDGGTLALPVAKTADFTANEQGVWTGNVGFSEVPAGAGYRILIKGPKHLQKKICAAGPTETYPGSYTCRGPGITLAAGANTLDFSKIFLLAGDLPEQGGAQNGFVNSFDLSLIRNNIGNTDSQVLQWADLNLDGVINTQDFSLVIAALEFRTDEQ